MTSIDPSAFADTAYLIGLIDPRDAHAGAAISLGRRLAAAQVGMVTTTAVLTELANYFARSPARLAAIDVVRAIRASAAWVVVELGPELLARSEARYRQFADKNWSLTDCISMEVMVERRMSRVATTDHGFAQAGFIVLMGAEAVG